MEMESLHECVVCREDFVETISKCKNGHNICNKCIYNTNACNICNSVKLNAKCPFFLTMYKCPWVGVEVRDHILIMHSNKSIAVRGLYRHNLQDMRINSKWSHVVLTLGTVFMCITKTTEDMFYSYVLCAGRDGNKYGYKLTLKTIDDSEGFFTSKPAVGYLDNMSKIYKNEQCMVLPFTFVKKFIRPNKKVVMETEIYAL